jgi:hypothetical protein
VSQVALEVQETAVGYWCADHKVFHAAETCPPAERVQDIPHGTLCRVTTNGHAPLNWRHKEGVLAVRDAIHTWLLILPRPVPFDPWATPDSTGWAFETRLFSEAIQNMGISGYVDDHFGWWAQSVASFERVTPDVPEDDPSVLSGLRTQLADAEDRVKAAQQALEDFKVHVSDVLGAEADEREWCDEYDDIAVRAGLLPRTRSHTVEIQVSYRQRVTVEARGEEQARDQVRSRERRRGWNPTPPITSAAAEVGVEDLSVTVVEPTPEIDPF